MEICNLTGLTDLCLQLNQLSGGCALGARPVARLDSLCCVLLSSTGSIPPGLENLRSLEVLCLFGNRLTGACSLAALAPSALPLTPHHPQ